MANVEHSTLTGSDLHEPKGVAAASANRVYVANGAGSGTWTTIGTAVLDAAAKAFQAQLLHVQDQKANNTSGGTGTASTWLARDLNTTLTNEISGASVSSNQISLPAGTYWLTANSVINTLACPARIRFRNVTDGTTTLQSLSTYGQGGTESTFAFVRESAVFPVTGRFTIAGTKTFELQYRYTGGSGGVNSLGQPTNSGEIEVYTDIQIWKIA